MDQIVKTKGDIAGIWTRLEEKMDQIVKNQGSHSREMNTHKRNNGPDCQNTWI